jgi:hypothetical protein
LLKKLNLLLLATVLLLGLSAGLALAQDAQPEEEPMEEPFTVYTLGQQTLSISAGLFIPLFYQSFGSGELYLPEGTTNLHLGGVGSLQWGIHLSNNWMAGLEVGGMFSKSTQERYLYMLPITAKGSYIIHFFPFEFPIYLGTGMAIVRYGGQTQLQTQLNWILKPGFSSIWKYNINWGFGLNVVYWWILQPWRFDDDPNKDLMGNFLEITMTAQYNF